MAAVVAICAPLDVIYDRLGVASGQAGARRWWRATLDSIEAGLLTTVSSDVPTTRAITISTTVPTGLEYGYRAMQGANWQRDLCTSAVVASVPVVAAVVTQAVLGRQPRPGQIGWTLMGLASGAAVGWARKQARERALRAWDDRLAGQADAERILAEARTVMAHHDGHDVRPLLSRLQLAGSTAAGEAIAELDARKVEVSGSNTGSTLLEASPVAVEPQDLLFVWLTNRQRDELLRFIGDADRNPDADRREDSLEVELVDERHRRNVTTLIEAELRVSYLGQATTIQALPSYAKGQPLTLILNSTPAGMAGAAVWKLTTARPVPSWSMPMGSVLPFAVADLLTVVVHRSTLGFAPAIHDHLVLACSAINSVGFAVAADRAQRRFNHGGTFPLCPTTAGFLGTSLLVGNYWNRLSRLRYAFLAVAVAGPMIAARRHPSRSWWLPLWEGCFAAMPCLAARNLQERMDREKAAVVNDAMDVYLDGVRRAAHDAALDVVERVGRHARLIRTETTRLRTELDDLEVADTMRQALRIQRWATIEANRLRAEVRG